MAYEGSPAPASSPSRDLNLQVQEVGDDYPSDLWYQGNDPLDGGPSSVEVQADLSDSPRSIGSASSHLDDFNNESLSPTHNPLTDADGGDLRIMGIANTWNDDDGFGNDSAVPARGDELTCIGLGQTATAGRWPSPLFPTTLDLFEDDRESVCELLGDVPDSNSIPGVCGLRNLGNTCFMNAGLQCLINTLPLFKYFHDHSVDVHGCNGVHLTAQFAAFLLKMWSGGYSTLRPAEFKHTLSLYHPQFKDYRQHDCQEFLALLLDTLHEHLSQMMEKKEGSAGGTSEAAATAGSIGRSADLPPECCLLNEEPMELYESSRSSQLSSPRSSSDSVETSSSCTTSCSSRAKAAALTLRSLPIPEEVKQPLFPLSIQSHHAQEGVDLVFKTSGAGGPHSPHKLVMERNVLNPSPDPAAQPPVLEKNLLSEISSIMKESKTANVNISAGPAESSANNEICFDSGKFESDPTKPRAAVASTLLRNSTEVVHTAATAAAQLAKSKVKNTNVLKEAAKRLSADQNIPLQSLSNIAVAETGSVDQSLPSPNNENVTSISKKARMESSSHQVMNGNGPLWDSLGVLETASQGCSAESPVPLPVVSRPKESVVTRTFQGQFRSTVVCCTCKHVSVTYEPFMYLSVPLPRALERTLDVVFVPASGDVGPSRHQLVLQQYDEMGKVRQALVKLLELDEERMAGGQLVLAEVYNRVIVRVLEDRVLLRQVTGGSGRAVYAFAVPPPAPELSLPSLVDPVLPSGSSQADDEAPTPMNEDEPDSSSMRVEHAWKQCAICLEDMPDAELRKHTSCSCLLCQACIETACRHHGGNSGQDEARLQCPVCNTIVKPDEEFAPLDKLHEYRPVIRLLNVPVLLRLAPSPAKSSRLLGHPRLLQLPNLMSAKGLYEVIGRLYPALPSCFELCFVDSQGVRCPRCVYPIRCNGCKISPDSEQISLQPGDCLAVQILLPEETEEGLEEQQLAKFERALFQPETSGSDQDGCVSSSSSSSRSAHEPLTLDDCLRAFSESETLDEGNPWFCPKCQKNQCASKTLTICQAPPYLIVYLKRFVFHDNSSSKLDNRVEFPLTGLNLQPYVDGAGVSSSSSLSNNESCSGGSDYVYDLYGLVCHFGSASSGHYTAYTRHVNSKDWHYYNDETVLSREPQEEDFSHGYVLFYQRRQTRLCSDSVEEEPSSSSNTLQSVSSDKK